MPDAAYGVVPALSLAPSPAPPQETRLIDPEGKDLSEQRFVASLESSGFAAPPLPDPDERSEESPEEKTAAEPGEAVASPGEAAATLGTAAWREEVAERLSHYRARRKPRPPRYPSLRLRFEEPSRLAEAAFSPPPAFETASSHALALDALTEAPVSGLRDVAQAHPSPEVELPAPAVRAATQPALNAGTPSAGAKIIEFPRSTFAPPVRSDELAEPVMDRDRPRILEVPEVTPPPPALGGITIEAVQEKDPDKQPGIDIPLQSAPLTRRLAAAAIDGVIIMAASALFGSIFWKVAAVRPPLVQILGLAAGVPCLLWAAYQYLLIVYAAGTPGLRLAGLDLARFDGTPTNRRLRRWRVLASYLSAISLGMGYAWLFLDEDALCWHDRITHTYLAPKMSRNKNQ